MIGPMEDGSKIPDWFKKMMGESASDEVSNAWLRWLEDEASDGAGMNTITPPCLSCAYRWKREPGATGPPRCDAFPAGIPTRVEVNEVIHNRALPELGQRNQLVYRPVGTAPDAIDEMR
jgi:hypothetical protein